MLIKQSTTSKALPFFMADSTDHITGKTGLTPTVVIKKNGGSFAAPAGAVTETGNGFYQVAGNATDTDTLGPLILSATASGADQATMAYDIVAFDPDVVAVGALQPTTAGRTLDVSTTGEAGLDFDNIKDASGAKTLTNIRIPVVTLVDTITTYTGDTPQTGDSYARIGATGSGLTSLAPSATALSTAVWTNTKAGYLDDEISSRMATFTVPASFAAADFTFLDAAITSRMATFTYTAPDNTSITAIKAKTDNLPATPAATGDAMTLTSGERTAIANEVETQIIDETDSEKVLTAITDKIASVNPSLEDLTLAAIASSVWANGTRTLTAGTNIVLAKGTGVTGFNDLDAAGVRTAVGLATNDLDAQLATLSTHSASDVWAVATRVLTAGTNIVLAKGTGITGFNDLSAGAVNAEVDTALADVGLTTTITGRIDAAISSRSTYAGADTAGTTTLLTRLTSTRAGLLDNLDATITSRMATFTYTTPPTATAIADEVETREMDANLVAVQGDATRATDLSTILDSNYINASISSRMEAFVLPENFEVLEISATGEVTVGTLPDPAPAGYGGAGGGATAEEIADAVWDEAQAGHVTSGTFGAYLDSSVSGVSTGGVSAGDIADAVWDEAGAGHVVSGTFGARLDALISSRSSHNAGDIWAVATRTLTAGTNIVLAKGTGITGFNDLSAAQVNTEVDTALSDVGLTTVVTGRIDAAISTRSTLAAGAAMTLTAGERTAIANEVETQIIDDTDSEKVLTAITDKIASVNPSLEDLTLGAIASSVWSNATRTLSAGTNIILAKGVGITGFNDLSAAQVNSEVDTALADVGLTTTITGRIDATVSSRSTYAGADTAGTTTLLGRLTSTRAGLLDNLDAAMSSRMATFTVPASFATTNFALLDVAVSTRNATTPPTSLAIATQVNTTLTAAHGAGAWNVSGSGGGGDSSFTEDDRAMLTSINNKITSDTVSITVQSPVTSTGTSINLVTGDTYHQADGRELVFSSEGWPDLTGATVVFKIYDTASQPSLSVSAEVVSASSVMVELDAEETATLSPGVFKFEIEATLPSGSIITLVRGKTYMEEDVI